MSSDPETLGWLVKRVQHRHHRDLDTKLGTLGISLVQWNALREIDRNPKCSQHMLAEKTFNSDQAFGTLLSRLQARALVERLPGAGRAVHHRLTKKGKSLFSEGQKIMSEVVSKSFSSLAQNERKELARLLKLVLNDEAP